MPYKLFILFFLTFGFNLGASQTITERSCPRLLMQNEIEGQTAICHTFEVPESWTHSNGQTIELAVLTLVSPSEAAKADPIIFLQGGPGGAALSTIEFWQDLSWRNSRDIILVDQRGTGYGEPNLKCPELLRSLDFKEATNECRDRLTNDGYDISYFNSQENAKDINALITALELEGVNLYGVSYGTRLALTMMRDTPEHIRTVVLDSTYPPQVKRLAEFGVNYERALNQVFTLCRESTTCNTAYPKLEDTFFEALGWLEQYPIMQPFTELEFGEQEILNILFQSMYDEAVIPSLPYAFERLADDDLNSFIAIVAGLATAEELDTGNFNVLNIWRAFADIFKFIWREVQSEGVYFSTECPEDVLFQSGRLVKRDAANLPLPLSILANDTASQMFTICRAWQSERGNKLESEAVVSDIPTLVLAGSFDPITPPSWGLRAAETLTNSFFFEFPNAAHGVFAATDCAVDMAESFFDNPLLSPDDSCMQEIEVEFYVPK